MSYNKKFIQRKVVYTAGHFYSSVFFLPSDYNVTSMYVFMGPRMKRRNIRNKHNDA